MQWYKNNRSLSTIVKYVLARICFVLKWDVEIKFYLWNQIFLSISTLLNTVYSCICIEVYIKNKWTYFEPFGSHYIL